MSEKKLKIIAVVCMVAAVICLAIGTAFAVDFIAEHPEEFACDLKKPVVAANRPLVDPVVEPPLMDFVVPDSMFGTWYVNFDYLPTSSDGYLVADYISDDPIYMSVLYQGVTYQLVSSVALSDQPAFAYDTGDGTVVDVTVTSSFYFIIDEGNVGFYDSDDNIVASSTVIASFPDGFLTRVESPSGVEIVGSIVDILISGLTATGEAMGEAFSVLAESIFINADGTGLSTFGILVVVFAAVSLGLSLTRFVLNFCTSWGKRNR